MNIFLILSILDKMSEFTSYINKSNVDVIRMGIDMKTSDSPFIPTQWLAQQTFTDMDHGPPYTRFFRGNPRSSEPIVFEREAGFRVHNDSCYRVNQCRQEGYHEPYPNHCFETACSTVYPCFNRDSLITIKPGCIPVVP
jgi:hypothetical protein